VSAYLHVEGVQEFLISIIKRFISFPIVFFLVNRDIFRIGIQREYFLVIYTNAKTLFYFDKYL
jgi:hypothetical protein